MFLKNLVGGLHTVYTKCKRLDIHPLVCNVEQVVYSNFLSLQKLVLSKSKFILHLFRKIKLFLKKNIKRI